MITTANTGRRSEGAYTERGPWWWRADGRGVGDCVGGVAQGRLNPIGNNGNILHPGIPATGAPGTGRSRGALLQYLYPAGFPRGTREARARRIRTRGPHRHRAIPWRLIRFAADNRTYAGNGFFQPQPGYYDPIWGHLQSGSAGYAGQSSSRSPRRSSSIRTSSRTPSARCCATIPTSNYPSPRSSRWCPRPRPAPPATISLRSTSSL